ncbi:MAG: 16S rRNA (cytidine(1402)-2'-O)-methyltransferase [Vicinamibacterales bacterium]
MPGILYVVATPIGNLEDVTLRALRVLREVSVIAAEDTRRTARLLQHYSISTPTTSLHEHNEHWRSAKLIERLAAGDSVALVSDAGTPVVSDPGVHLVAAAHDHGIRVEPIPGANAAVAAISAAGLPGDGFLFAGFPPTRSNARLKWLQALTNHHRPIVLYEAPHRILGTLRDISTTFGGRKVAIARELTKTHEILAVRPIETWLEMPPPERGEFTLVIAGAQAASLKVIPAPSDQDVSVFFDRLTNNMGLERRLALKATAEHFNVRARDVFAAVDRARVRSDDINLLDED